MRSGTFKTLTSKGCESDYTECQYSSSNHSVIKSFIYQISDLLQTPVNL